MCKQSHLSDYVFAAIGFGFAAMVFGVAYHLVVFP